MIAAHEGDDESEGGTFYEARENISKFKKVDCIVDVGGGVETEPLRPNEEPPHDPNNVPSES